MSEPIQTKTRTSTVYEDAMVWDASMVLAREASERKAWLVAAAFGVLAALCVLAVVFLLPLKKTEPYVIRVDNATGVPDVITTLTSKDVGKDEVTQKYFLADYVRAREGYDWYTLQKDYDKTRLYSAPLVSSEYGKLFEGADSLDKKYRNKVKVTVQIQSIVPPSSETRLVGTVRFSKTIKNLDDTLSAGVTTKWVATIAFSFNDSSNLTESQRLINPFGFQVISYRVDQEMGGQ